MKPWKKLAIICALFSTAAQANENPWVTVVNEDGAVTIRVLFRDTELQPERYTLEVVKAGPNGTAINKQGGSLEGSKVDDVLVRSRISLEPGSVLKVGFEVYSKGSIVYNEVEEIRL